MKIYQNQLFMHIDMPPKIKELIKVLEEHGFSIVKNAGKGSHIKLKDDTGIIAILRGKLNLEAPKYLVKHTTNKNLPPHRWLRKYIKSDLVSELYLPPHRWLRKSYNTP